MDKQRAQMKEIRTAEDAKELRPVDGTQQVDGLQCCVGDGRLGHNRAPHQSGSHSSKNGPDQLGYNVRRHTNSREDSEPPHRKRDGRIHVATSHPARWTHDQASYEERHSQTHNQ